jgi:hypothetical protein
MNVTNWKMQERGADENNRGIGGKDHLQANLL